MELDRDLFLPVSREDMARRGWDFYDFLLITGDAYVDHPLLRPRHHRPGTGGGGLPGGRSLPSPTGGGRRPSPPWDAPGWGC